MADQLYLSLWYPNFRLEALPAALTGVLRQFALIATDGKPNSPFARVHAASTYPISWTESPTYQRIYVNDDRAAEGPDTHGSIIESAVAEATDQLHMDTAYEFEMRWALWIPDTPTDDRGSTRPGSSNPPRSASSASAPTSTTAATSRTAISA